MSSPFHDWKELRNILFVVVLSMIVLSILDVTGANIPRYAVLLAIFIVGMLAVVLKGEHSL